jgi:hypothetical protein
MQPQTCCYIINLYHYLLLSLQGHIDIFLNFRGLSKAKGTDALVSSAGRMPVCTRPEGRVPQKIKKDIDMS